MDKLGGLMANIDEPTGPGRPAELEDGKRTNVYLDSDAVEVAKQVGDGNLSLGLRRALEKLRPATIETVIERIRSLHIFNTDVRLFVEDLEKLVTSLQTVGQTEVLHELDIDDQDAFVQMWCRKSYEVAAAEHGAICFEVSENKFVSTSKAELDNFLESIGGTIKYDGAYHLFVGASCECSRAEKHELIEAFLGGAHSPWPSKATTEEASADFCRRKQHIQPAELRPANYLLVSNDLADELDAIGEIVSRPLIGSLRVWGCLDDPKSNRWPGVKALRRIADNEEAVRKLLGIRLPPGRLWS
jgi:hypothetical protein